jgi:hypothetical protein
LDLTFGIWLIQVHGILNFYCRFIL